MKMNINSFYACYVLMFVECHFVLYFVYVYLSSDPRVVNSFYGNIIELKSQQKLYPVVVIATTHSPNNLSCDMYQCFLHELNIEVGIFQIDNFIG